MFKTASITRLGLLVKGIGGAGIGRSTDVVKANEIVAGMVQGVCIRHDLEISQTILGVVIFTSKGRKVGIVRVEFALAHQYPPLHHSGCEYQCVIELSEAEIELSALDSVTAPNKLSNVGREKVEPEIDRLVDERRSPFDRAYLERLRP